MREFRCIECDRVIERGVRCVDCIAIANILYGIEHGMYGDPGTSSYKGAYRRIRELNRIIVTLGGVR